MSNERRPTYRNGVPASETGLQTRSDLVDRRPRNLRFAEQQFEGEWKLYIDQVRSCAVWRRMGNELSIEYAQACAIAALMPHEHGHRIIFTSTKAQMDTQPIPMPKVAPALGPMVVTKPVSLEPENLTTFEFLSRFPFISRTQLDPAICANYVDTEGKGHDRRILLTAHTMKWVERRRQQSEVKAVVQKAVQEGEHMSQAEASRAFGIKMKALNNAIYRNTLDSVLEGGKRLIVINDRFHTWARGQEGYTGPRPAPTPAPNETVEIINELPEPGPAAEPDQVAVTITVDDEPAALRPSLEVGQALHVHTAPTSSGDGQAPEITDPFSRIVAARKELDIAWEAFETAARTYQSNRDELIRRMAKLSSMINTL